MASSNAQDKRLVEVARSFYESQLSKSEIAKMQRISITHVNRLLKDAQRQGIVEVSIRPPRFEDLEAELARRFGLHEVRVVGSTPNADLLRRELAEAAAEHLQARLRDGLRIGVASGRTILETISRIKEAPRKIEIYPLNVLANDDVEVKSLSANALSTILWHKFRPLAKAFRFELFFPGKSVSEIRNASKLSLSGSAARELRAKIEDLDVYVLSVSELRKGSQLLDLSEDLGSAIEKLRSISVVGDVAFNAFDEHGRGLSIGLEDFVFHVGLNTLKHLSTRRERSVLLIGGGGEKLVAIKAALDGRICNELVTDRDTAEAVLERACSAQGNDRVLLRQ